jgi:hypothetical protein
MHREGGGLSILEFQIECLIDKCCSKNPHDSTSIYFS